MRLSEIVNIPDLRGDFSSSENDEFLRSRWEQNRKSLKFIAQLPNGFDVWGTRWPLTTNYTKLYFLENYFVENTNIVGSAMVYIKDPSASTKTITVEIINILASHQKRGIGFHFYSFLLENGYKILSDVEQTSASKKLWNKLSKMYTARFYDTKTEKFSDPVDNISKAYRVKHLKILLTK